MSPVTGDRWHSRTRTNAYLLPGTDVGPGGSVQNGKVRKKYVRTRVRRLGDLGAERF